MKELIKATLDSDFVVFNEKFKDKLKAQYVEKTKAIKDNINKVLFSEMVVNDGKNIAKCSNCGKSLIPGVPVMGSCPYCGDLLT